MAWSRRSGQTTRPDAAQSGQCAAALEADARAHATIDRRPATSGRGARQTVERTRRMVAHRLALRPCHGTDRTDPRPHVAFRTARPQSTPASQLAGPRTNPDPSTRMHLDQVTHNRQRVEAMAELLLHSRPTLIPSVLVHTNRPSSVSVVTGRRSRWTAPDAGILEGTTAQADESRTFVRVPRRWRRAIAGIKFRETLVHMPTTGGPTDAGKPVLIKA